MERNPTEDELDTEYSIIPDFDADDDDEDEKSGNLVLLASICLSLALILLALAVACVMHLVRQKNEGLSKVELE